MSSRIRKIGCLGLAMSAFIIAAILADEGCPEYLDRDELSFCWCIDGVTASAPSVRATSDEKYYHHHATPSSDSAYPHDTNVFTFKTIADSSEIVQCYSKYLAKNGFGIVLGDPTIKGVPVISAYAEDEPMLSSVQVIRIALDSGHLIWTSYGGEFLDFGLWGLLKNLE